MDISTFTLADLKALLVQIPKEIERRQIEEKNRVRREIEAFAAERGFVLSDLMGKAVVKSERAPVAVKYKHPTDATLTWTGRGRQPKWIAEFLENGGTLAELAV